MPFTLDVADGQIDQGEDKRVAFTPTGADGNATSVSAIDLTLTSEQGTTIQKDQTDFSADGDQQVVIVRLNEAGTWQVNLEVTGAGQGSVERVQGQIYVAP
jgi:hypothetical protein